MIVCVYVCGWGNDRGTQNLEALHICSYRSLPALVLCWK